MGIHQLTKVIQLHAPKAIKTRDIKYYNGYTLAIDASLSLYQFLIAVRSEGSGLTTTDGETTSHLVGMFYRTIRIVSSGIKPIYVFDGLPPALKLSHELEKRQARRDVAIKEYEEAVKIGDKEKMEKFDKRKTKVSAKHVDDCKKLLKLLNIPFIDAPSEAEAYCAYLCQKGIVDGVATEDMDALTFGTPIFLRNLNAAENKKLPISEYNLDFLLKEFKLNMNEFIDLCILLGCDYVPTIKGIGPKKAFDYITKYRSLENILKNKDLLKLKIPSSNNGEEEWEYEKARQIFKELPFVDIENEIKLPSLNFNKIDVEGLLKFLVEENGFSKERVLKGVERFKTVKTEGKQMRLESFFKKKE